MTGASRSPPSARGCATTSPASLRGAVLARGELYWPAAAGLLRAVTEGGTAFEHVHGERFFEHLAGEPEREAAFQASMADRARRETADVVAAYDFAGLRDLVDVGGGSGVMLEAILRAAPRLRGVLVDRPEAVARARARSGARPASTAAANASWATSSTRWPPGADAYLLSRVIHDWDDDDARRILTTCRAAMPVDARLLLVEAIVPERARDGPEAVRMDLHMLMLFSARERTQAQYRRPAGRRGIRAAAGRADRVLGRPERPGGRGRLAGTLRTRAGRCLTIAAADAVDHDQEPVRPARPGRARALR